MQDTTLVGTRQTELASIFSLLQSLESFTDIPGQYSFKKANMLRKASNALEVQTHFWGAVLFIYCEQLGEQFLG